MADKFKPQTAHAQPQNVPAKPTEIRRNAPPSQNAPLTFVQAVKASQKQSGNGSWCFEAKNDPSVPISLHSTTARGTPIEGINDYAICHSSATLSALGVTLLRASEEENWVCITQASSANLAIGLLHDQKRGRLRCFDPFLSL
jgi:hypothetical protein